VGAGPVASEARPPGRPRSEQAEQVMLAAALDLFAEHGMAGLSIEAVAARAGVAKTTVYRRWSAKDELVLDALVRLRGPTLQPPGGSVRDDLVWLLTQMRRRWRQESTAPLMRRLIADADQHPGLVDEYWRRIIVPRREVLHGVLRRGIAEGAIRADADVDLLGDMLVAPLLLRTVIRPTALSDQQIADVVDTVLAGVRP
jgi:AcrR family transcriptional regulator